MKQNTKRTSLTYQKTQTPEVDQNPFNYYSWVDLEWHRQKPDYSLAARDRLMRRPSTSESDRKRRRQWEALENEKIPFNVLYRDWSLPFSSPPTDESNGEDSPTSSITDWPPSPPATKMVVNQLGLTAHSKSPAVVTTTAVRRSKLEAPTKKSVHKLKIEAPTKTSVHNLKIEAPTKTSVRKPKLDVSLARNIGKPKLEAPMVRAVNKPKLEAPTVRAVNNPKVEARAVRAVPKPKLETPMVTAVCKPKLKAPAVRAVSKPKLDVPTARAVPKPKLEAPMGTAVRKPKLEVSTVRNIGKPKLEAPTVRSVRKPKLEAPMVTAISKPKQEAPIVTAVRKLKPVAQNQSKVQPAAKMSTPNRRRLEVLPPRASEQLLPVINRNPPKTGKPVEIIKKK